MMEKEVLKDLFCRQCQLQFDEISVYNKHQCEEKVVKNKKLKENDTSFQEGKKQFNCNVCSSSYGLKSTLKRHIATVHDGKKTIQM